MGTFFTDVISNDPRFKSTRRVDDLELLEPVLRKKVQAIVQDAAGKGIVLGVFETYRSQTRQTQLFNEGRTRLKEVGVHHFGLACDLVRRVDGRYNWDVDHSLVGQLAEKHRLVWGGVWKSIYDPYHVQRVAVERQKELFAGTFYPGEDYDPLTDAVKLL